MVLFSSVFFLKGSVVVFYLFKFSYLYFLFNRANKSLKFDDLICSPCLTELNKSLKFDDLIFCIKNHLLSANITRSQRNVFQKTSLKMQKQRNEFTHVKIHSMKFSIVVQSESGHSSSQ